MRKAFFISIAIMTITMIVTVMTAAFYRNAMDIVIYAQACVAATVISGIIIFAADDIAFSFYSYSWLFYTGGHLLTTILLLVSEWDLTKVRMDSKTIPTIAVPFVVSAILFVLAELLKEKE